MDYMTQSGTITTELEMKAMEYINAGYQALLSFECKDGGFNWWEGDNPGNAILTALSIQMFTDTKAIYDTVDEAVNQRSAEYLIAGQKSDGSWAEETHLHAGNESLGAGSLRTTCYIAWSLAYGGFGDMPGVTKALTYIQSNLAGEESIYTKAMCANALVTAKSNATLAADLLKEFHDAAINEDGAVHWGATGDTVMNSGGSAADVELTSLIALAMAGKGAFPQDVNGAVEYLVQSKDPQGNWGYNTQATVLALKVFLASLTQNPGETNADVAIIFNGEEMATKHFDNGNKDVVYQFEITEGLVAGEQEIQLDYAGTGALSYQVIGTHYIPWDNADMPEGPLSISVSYDSVSVHIDDIVTATVSITNNDEGAKGMVLVTVGLPPGFTLVAQDLASLQEDGIINNFEVLGKSLILYFNEIPAGEPTTVSYSLIADFPVKAETGGSEAKYYYNAEVKGEEESQEIEVLP
jgi:alpha-2-macroglobulin-like protein